MVRLGRVSSPRQVATPTRNTDEPEKKMSDQAIPTYVCESCRMKLPSIIHGQSHKIVHGLGHETKIAYLDAAGTSVAP